MPLRRSPLNPGQATPGERVPTAGSERPLGGPEFLLRLGAIGALVLAAAAGFAYVGICVSGWFESTGAATLLSKSEILEPGRVPVIGRFALAGGLPMQADTASAIRSLALRFLEPDGQEWRTGMNDIPVFPVNTAQAFYEQLLASKSDPATGTPDPTAMQAFLPRHPETVRALALIKSRTLTPGFADSTFNSLDAFRLVDVGGRSTPVRWSATPLEPLPAGAEPRSGSGDNYLFDDLIVRLRQRPLNSGC
jgi:catalase